MNNPDGVETMGTSAILVEDIIKIVKKVGSQQAHVSSQQARASSRQSAKFLKTYQTLR